MVAAEEDKRSVVAVLLEHNAKVDLTDVVSACMYILLSHTHVNFQQLVTDNDVMTAMLSHW